MVLFHNIFMRESIWKAVFVCFCMLRLLCKGRYLSVFARIYLFEHTFISIDSISFFTNFSCRHRVIIKSRCLCIWYLTCSIQNIRTLWSSPMLLIQNKMSYTWVMWKARTPAFYFIPYLEEHISQTPYIKAVGNGLILSFYHSVNIDVILFFSYRIFLLQFIIMWTNLSWSEWSVLFPRI